MANRYALLIGTSEYHDERLARLKTPAADLNVLAKLLGNRDIGDYQVKILLNQPFTTVLKEIVGFLKDRHRDDHLLLYFSGHGVLDEGGNLYLATKDTERDLLSATALSNRFIRDEMDRSRSKRQVLILDCCHSGAFLKGTKGAGPALTQATFEGYGRAVLTAADSVQYALEGDQVDEGLELSLFTHFLVEGIQTGEADRGNDGWIELDEWFDYAFRKVRDHTDRQTPRKFVDNQYGELYIARNPKASVIKPVELPERLRARIKSEYKPDRLEAIQELGGLLDSDDPSMVATAQIALEKIAVDDDSLSIRSSAAGILTQHAERQSFQKAEEERQAREQAEAERLMRAKAEAERLEALKAEEKRLARERVEVEKQARQKAKEERERAEADRQARQRAEHEHLAQKKTRTEQFAPRPVKAGRMAGDVRTGRVAGLEVARIVVKAYGEMEFVRVPAGKFLMGSKETNQLANDDEKPQHSVDIPQEYWIGRYPVTNAQFAAFVKATAYRTTAMDRGSGYAWIGQEWKETKGADWQHPGGPKSDLDGKEDHPVVLISWLDAQAFCLWLNKTCGSELPDGWQIRLPTEAEWEKSARGEYGNEWPWGDEQPDANRCNFKMNVGDTTPVGQYSPQGDSPYGASGMVGNTWEWTHTQFKRYPYLLLDGREAHDSFVLRLLRGGPTARVLRGGSFGDGLESARCPCRIGFNPDFCCSDHGFRVVASPIHL